MFDIVLKISLVVTLLGYVNNVSLKIYDLKIFHLSVIALLIVGFFSVSKRDLSQTTKRVLALLLAACFVNAALHGCSVVVMTSLINTVLGVAACLAIFLYTDNPKSIKKLLILLAFINIGIYFLHILWPLQIAFSGGLMGNAPRLASFLALCLAYALNVNALLGLIFVSICIYMREISSVGVLILLLFLSCPHKYLKVALTLSLVGAIYFFREKMAVSFYHRFTNWKPAVEYFFQQPLAGYGIGVFPFGDKYESAGQDLSIFSSLLQMVLCGGPLLAIWLFNAVKKFIFSFYNNDDNLAVAGFLALSIFEYPLEIPRLWLVIAVIFGFYLIRRDGHVFGNS